MRREIRADGEYEFDDATGQCRRVKIPVVLLDGDPVQRQIAASKAPANSYARYCADAAAEAERHRAIGAALAGNRTGYAVLSDEQRQRSADAYGEMVEAVSTAWQRRPGVAPAADAEQVQRSNSAEVPREEYVRSTCGAWRRR